MERLPALMKQRRQLGPGDQLNGDSNNNRSTKVGQRAEADIGHLCLARHCTNLILRVQPQALLT